MKYNSDNLILKVDSYKSGQYKQYVDKVSSLFSYLESRGGVYPATVFFGLQYYLKKYLSTPITIEDVEEAKKFFSLHGTDFNYEGWLYIATELKGKLPVRIRSVKEGALIPVSNILMSIESTDPKVYWIVNWLETLLLKVWYPTTVATQSHYLRETIYNSLVETSDNPDVEIDFKLHSFGYRGVSSEESAMVGAMSELVSFKGSDTLAGIIGANLYYNAGDMCGFSINASEHSTITSWKQDGEIDAYRNMIKQFGKPGAVFACVSDSWDIYNAINIWGTILKDELINSGATLVIRSDSGDPSEVVPKCLELMAERFGYTVNSKGYKVINTVKLIHGDGVNPTSITQMIKKVKELGFSMTNLAFGMGGASLQGSSANTINRDTQKFAFKASHMVVDGADREIYKLPATDPSKVSKRGILDLVKIDGEYKTVQGYSADSEMEIVYQNGEVLIDDTFDNIRSRTVGALV